MFKLHDVVLRSVFDCLLRQRTHRTQSNGSRPVSIPSSYPNKSGHDTLVQSYDHSKIHEEEIYNRNLSLIRLPFYDHMSQILPPTILSKLRSPHGFKVIVTESGFWYHSRVLSLIYKAAIKFINSLWPCFNWFF